MTTMKYKDFIAILRLNGYYKQRGNGSHQFFINKDGDTIMFPVHSRDMNPIIVNKLIREHNLKTR